jgi:hypothetical protein
MDLFNTLTTAEDAEIEPITPPACEQITPLCISEGFNTKKTHLYALNFGLFLF